MPVTEKLEPVMSLCFIQSFSFKRGHHTITMNSSLLQPVTELVFSQIKSFRPGDLAIGKSLVYAMPA
jgi:hypothetical protein